MLVLFGLGFAIRMVDLTDPPLDFHPTRQLRSAIIARSMYYRSLPEEESWQQQAAIGQYTGEGIIEPLVMETIVANTYKVIGSEAVWVARIYSSLFWIVGGIGLYFLTSAMTSPDGGVLATAYYLFVPFGIIASRSFQPDPLMVMLIILALWALYFWYRNPSWKTAALAGVLAGMALFVKAVALFPILFAMAAFILFAKGIRKAIKDPQIWLIAGLSLLPLILYMLYGIFFGSMESQFLGRFFPGILARFELLFQLGGYGHGHCRLWRDFCSTPRRLPFSNCWAACFWARFVDRVLCVWHGFSISLHNSFILSLTPDPDCSNFIGTNRSIDIQTIG